jgi:hypothetical protein
MVFMRPPVDSHFSSYLNHPWSRAQTRQIPRREHCRGRTTRRRGRFLRQSAARNGRISFSVGIGIGIGSARVVRARYFDDGRSAQWRSWPSNIVIVAIVRDEIGRPTFVRAIRAANQ